MGPRADLDIFEKKKSLAPARNQTQDALNASMYQIRAPYHLAVKGKGKVHPCTGSEALYRPYGPLGEQRYSSTLSLPQH